MWYRAEDKRVSRRGTEKKGSELSPREPQPRPSPPGVRAQPCSLPGGEGPSPAAAQRGGRPAVGWRPPSSHSRTKSRNPVWTCLVQHGEVRRLQALQRYMCVLTHVFMTHTQAHTDTCVCLCLCVHTCAFSPLSRLLDLGSCSPGPDSARVRQRRAATKSPDSCLPPSTPQSALLPITPTAEGPAPRQRLRDRGRGAQLCDGCREGQSTVTPSPSRCPPARRSRQSLPLPLHLSCHPEPHGNGITGAGAREQGCPRPGALALSNLQRSARLCTAA